MKHKQESSKKAFAYFFIRISRAAMLIPLCVGVLTSPAWAQGGAASKAPSNTWKETIAAANREGRVVLYGGIAVPTVARLKADFEKANPGITLEYTRYVGTIGNTKLDQERQMGADGADTAVLTDLGWVEERAKEGAIAAPSGPSAGAWPPAHMIRGVAPVLVLESTVIVYNTNLVKTPITGYQDLLKPEFKGKLGTLGLVVAPLAAWYEWLEKTQGADFLPRLATQQPVIYGSAIAGAQSVASGEFLVAAYVSTSSAVPIINQGAPIKMVVPNPAFAVRYAGGVLSWAKRPNAAQVLLDYMMSARGQTIWHGLGESASPLPNIPGSQDARSITPFDYSAYPPEVVRAYTEKWNRIFKK